LLLGRVWVAGDVLGVVDAAPAAFARMADAAIMLSV
jgi:hypothetical protein